MSVKNCPPLEELQLYVVMMNACAYVYLFFFLSLTFCVCACVFSFVIACYDDDSLVLVRFSLSLLFFNPLSVHRRQRSISHVTFFYWMSQSLFFARFYSLLCIQTFVWMWIRFFEIAILRKIKCEMGNGGGCMHCTVVSRLHNYYGSCAGLCTLFQGKSVNVVRFIMRIRVMKAWGWLLRRFEMRTLFFTTFQWDTKLRSNWIVFISGQYFCIKVATLQQITFTFYILSHSLACFTNERWKIRWNRKPRSFYLFYIINS